MSDPITSAAATPAPASSSGPSANALLSVSNLSFRYPDAQSHAIQDLSFELAPGELMLLCGPSGSGKSTLLRLLKAQIAPAGDCSGSILLNGCELSSLSDVQSAAAVAFVPQRPADQLIMGSVRQELAFGPENLGLDAQTMGRRIAETAHYLGLSTLLDTPVHALSGGQQRLLNLASVLVMQAKVLLLDEPVSQLDPLAAQRFLEVIQRLRRDTGLAIIVAEHRLEDILPFADKLLLLQDGKARYMGPASAYVPAAPASTSPAAPATTAASSAASTAASTAVDEAEATCKPAGEVLIRCKELYYRYESKAPFVIRGLELELRSDEVHAILGANACGKSTLLKLVAGVLSPWRGRVKRASGCSVALLPQDPRLLFSAPSLEADLMDWAPRFGYNRQELEQQMLELGLAQELLASHPSDLSGGEVQRAALCKLLLAKPRLILLDEPSKGLDHAAKQQLAAVLTRLAQNGRGIVLVSHDVDFAAQAAQRVSLIFDGGIACTQSSKEFFSQSLFFCPRPAASALASQQLSAAFEDTPYV